MKYSLLEHIICPNSGGLLKLEVKEESNGEVKTGLLISEISGDIYQIQNFIPRFVPAEKYADSFSRQRLYVRRHFKHYRNDRSGDQLFYPSTDFSDHELSRGGLILEAGCGYGRFLDVLSRKGVENVIGIDLSTHSINLAQQFVGSRSNVHLIQCDLFSLPFKLASFKRIFSIGVLHHTPSTQEAFNALVPYVLPGGRIAIWVYPPSMKRTADIWRIVTKHLPHSVLYYSCIINQLLTGWIRGLPGGWRLDYIIPGAPPKHGKHFWLRVMSDFDNLSPTYAFSHSPEEVADWFKSAGLKDVRSLDRITAVVGRRPNI